MKKAEAHLKMFFLILAVSLSGCYHRQNNRKGLSYDEVKWLEKSDRDLRELRK